MSLNDFVLDQAGNPHPRLLKEVQRLQLNVITTWDWGAFCCYLGFIAGMCAATGESLSAMLAWVDSHADTTNETRQRDETTEIQRVGHEPALS